MGIKEIFLMARDLMSKHSELDLWRFSFENYKKSFGRCNYTTRTISISSYLCDSMTDIAVKDTLIHEIAHALTRGHGHDYVWRRKCAELGGVPERTASLSKFGMPRPRPLLYALVRLLSTWSERPSPSASL